VNGIPRRARRRAGAAISAARSRNFVVDLSDIGNEPETKNTKPYRLYIDEFQNFGTSIISAILSESGQRKLCLTLTRSETPWAMETSRHHHPHATRILPALHMQATDRSLATHRSR
jgi:hypothetical protein